MARLFIPFVEDTIAYDDERSMPVRVDWPHFDRVIRFSCPPPVAVYRGCNRRSNNFD
jgi:hypothetical protein